MNRFLVTALVVGIVSGCGSSGSAASPRAAATPRARVAAASVHPSVAPTVGVTVAPTDRPGLIGPQPTDATPSVASRTVPRFGPAGNGIIALAKDGDIVVADRPGGDLRPLVAGPENDHSPMFSPDGTRLAFLRDTGLETFIMIADGDGTNVVQISPAFSMASGSWFSHGSFAPDGESLVALAEVDGEMRFVIRPVDPAGALTVLDIRPPGAWEGIEHPKFRPTNPQEVLVVAQLEPGDSSGIFPRGIYVYDLATGGIRTIVETADYPYLQDVEWFPDGEHIIYTLGLNPRIVAADGSGDQAFDALRGRLSPLSNDGTKIVAERGGEGLQTPGPPVIVPINGDGEPVVLAFGPGTDIAYPWYWSWSPDDSMLIGTVYHEETSSSGESSLGAATYLLVDAHTGQVTELDWREVVLSSWQRVAP